MEKVENKQTVEKKAETNYVPMKEMTDDQIRALNRATLYVKQETNRFSNKTLFTASCLLMEGKFEHNFRIDRASYFLIAKLRGVDSSKGFYKVSFPFRICKGKRINKEGKEYDYYYIEGYACPLQKKVYLHDFLKGSSVDLLLAFNYPGIVDRGIINEDELETSTYFDELI